MNPEKLVAVDNYIGDLFGREDDVLIATRESLPKAGMPDYSVSPNQGKLLQILALACGAKTILEVGTLGGYSTIWMARGLPAGGRLISLEVDGKHAQVARENVERAGLSSRVEIRVGSAIDSLPALVSEGAGPFDMIFIDADKPPYAEYLKWALRLARPGTLIVADNVVFGGGVLETDTTNEMYLGIRRFNADLAANPDLTATIVQTVGVKGHDGIAIAVVALRP